MTKDKDRVCEKCKKKCFGKICRECYINPKVNYGSKTQRGRLDSNNRRVQRLKKQK